MEALAKAHGFRFLCHERGHSDRKAGEERSLLTAETNSIPGRTFPNLEDLNRRALEWSRVRMEQRLKLAQIQEPWGMGTFPFERRPKLN